MPSIDAFVGTESQPLALGGLIALKPSSTGTITRGSSTISARTVRLETLSGQKQVQGSNGVVHEVDAMVLGYKNYPNVTDTDLRPGDRFSINGQAYEVVIVMPGHTDCLQVYLRLRA